MKKNDDAKRLKDDDGIVAYHHQIQNFVIIFICLYTRTTKTTV